MTNWQPIKSAPRDGSEFLAYSQDLGGNGLPPLISLCAWHPDAGFCTDELREATHWMRLRDRTKLKFITNCKCGKCQCVPATNITEAAALLERARELLMQFASIQTQYFVATVEQRDRARDLLKEIEKP